jgi:hypothetical protein
MTSHVGSGFLVFQYIEVWFMDSGYSWNMTRMRLVFLSLSETYSDCVVGSGPDSRLAVKGVGSVRFQLESVGFRGVVYSKVDS